MDSIEFGQTALGVAPKSLDAVDMMDSLSEVVLSVVDYVMLSIPQVHQAIIAFQAVGVNNGLVAHFPLDCFSESGSGAIGDDLGVDPIVSLQDAKDDSFFVGSPAAFAPDAPGAEIGFVDLDDSGDGSFQTFTIFSNPATKLEIEVVGSADAEAGQFRADGGGQIEGEALHYLPEFGLADFRTAIVPIFIRHDGSLAHLSMPFAS